MSVWSLNYIYILLILTDFLYNIYFEAPCLGKSRCIQCKHGQASKNSFDVRRFPRKVLTYFSPVNLADHIVDHLKISYEILEPLNFVPRKFIINWIRSRNQPLFLCYFCCCKIIFIQGLVTKKWMKIKSASKINCSHMFIWKCYVKLIKIAS